MLFRSLSMDSKQSIGLELYRGKGCPSCSNTGFKGRMGIYELLVLNDKLRELILENTPSTVLCERAREFGMRTLKEDGVEKVKRGYTTVEEVLRVTQDA